MRDKLLQQYGFDQRKNDDGKGIISEEIQEETESQHSSGSDDYTGNINQSVRTSNVTN